MSTNVTYRKNFWRKMQELIDEAGSMQKAAKIMKINYKDLHKMRQRMSVPGGDRIAIICRGFNCAADWLLMGKGPKYVDPSPEQQQHMLVPVMARAASQHKHNQKLLEGEHYHQIEVMGDSMMPVALEGQHVIVTDERPVDGGLAVIEKKDGKVLFKRVYFEGARIFCHSINSDPKFRPILLKRAQIRHLFKIVGILLS